MYACHFILASGRTETFLSQRMGRAALVVCVQILLYGCQTLLSQASILPSWGCVLTHTGLSLYLNFCIVVLYSYDLT